MSSSRGDSFAEVDKKKKKRAKEISCDITYTWTVKHDTSELSVKQKQTHRHGEQTCGCHRDGLENG